MEERLKKYEVLLFDIDDTLIDLKESKKLTYKVMCKHFNRIYSEIEFNILDSWENNFFDRLARNEVKIPKQYDTFQKRNAYVTYMCLHNTWGISFEETEAVQKMHTDIMKSNIVPIPNVEETIKYLSQKYKLVIATNGNADLIYPKLEAANISKYFNKIVIAKDIQAFKPEASFFARTMRKINYYNIPKMIMIGDSYVSDIQGALNIGITPIWFNYRNEPNLNYELKNGYIIYNFNELQNIL